MQDQPGLRSVSIIAVSQVLGFFRYKKNVPVCHIIDKSKKEFFGVVFSAEQNDWFGHLNSRVTQLGIKDIDEGQNEITSEEENAVVQTQSGFKRAVEQCFTFILTDLEPLPYFQPSSLPPEVKNSINSLHEDRESALVRVS